MKYRLFDSLYADDLEKKINDAAAEGWKVLFLTTMDGKIIILLGRGEDDPGKANQPHT